MALDATVPFGRSPASVLSAVLLIAALVRRRRRGDRRDLDLPRGEVVLFRGRPRRSVLRYACSLGVSELRRRTTFFAVTNRRVVLDQGILRRRTHSIPLAGIVDVDVITGPLEGVLCISEHGRGAEDGIRIGPLRSPAARRLAATIAAHAGQRPGASPPQQ